MRTKLPKVRLQILKTLDSVGTERFFINYNPAGNNIKTKEYPNKADLVADMSTIDLVSNNWVGASGLNTGAANIPADQKIQSQISFSATENLGGGTVAALVVVINRGNPPQDVLTLPSGAPLSNFLTAFNF